MVSTMTATPAGPWPSLDVVVRHIGSLGLGDDGRKTGVIRRVGNTAALLDRDDHFLGDLGKCRRALGVLRALGFLNVMPLGMSGHEESSLQKFSFVSLSQVSVENQLFSQKMNLVVVVF